MKGTWRRFVKGSAHTGNNLLCIKKNTLRGKELLKFGAFLSFCHQSVSFRPLD